MKEFINIFWEYFLKLIFAVIIVGVLIILFYFIAKIIKNRLIYNYQKQNNNYKLWKIDFMFSLIFIPLALFAVYIWFQIIGIKSDIILWVVAIWMWVALEQIISDLLASVFILSTPDLKIGKSVQVEMWSNSKIFGKIVSVNTRTTTLAMANKRKIILPNTALIVNPVKSFNTDILRRQIEFYVHHKTDIEKLRRITIEVINSFDEAIAKDSTRLDLEWFTPNWLHVIAYFFTQKWKFKNLLIVYKKMKKALLKRFFEEGIDFQRNNLVLSFDDDGKSLQEYKKFFNQ